MKEEELLEEAKRRYSIGTKFKPAHISMTDEYCIMTDDSVIEDLGGYLVARVNGMNYIDDCNPKYGNTSLNRVLYYDHKWAEIIEPETHGDLLDEAKRRYPFGTKYTTAADNGEEIYTVYEQSFRINFRDGLVQVFGESGKGCLYHDGKWAPIIVEESKDDKHVSKYNVGDTVQICAEKKDNGSGWCNTDLNYEHIIGVAHRTEIITGIHYHHDKQEYYYSFKDIDGGRVAEHALSLVSEATAPPQFVHKYKVGQIVYLKYKINGVPPGKQIINYLTPDGYVLERFHDNYEWAGIFSEKYLTDDWEEIESKFKLGQAVQFKKDVYGEKKGTICIVSKRDLSGRYKLEDVAPWINEEDLQHPDYSWKTDKPSKPVVEHDLKIGDKVTINKASEHNYQGIGDNGELLMGTVEEYNKTTTNYFYQVRWENGKSNSYRDEDLYKPSVSPPISPTSFKMLSFTRI